ncbi:hypothetical protein CPB85DRAFT_416243 [Mucidula mucida]|nr:hypothetical protein CPB85DRAFT_416243 [Mucidula mucida]
MNYRCIAAFNAHHRLHFIVRINTFGYHVIKFRVLPNSSLRLDFSIMLFKRTTSQFAPSFDTSAPKQIRLPTSQSGPFGPGAACSFLPSTPTRLDSGKRRRTTMRSKEKAMKDFDLTEPVKLCSSSFFNLFLSTSQNSQSIDATLSNMYLLGSFISPSRNLKRILAQLPSG